MKILTFNEYALNESADLPRVEFECTCADISSSEWDELMKGRRKFSYAKMVKIIQQQYPELYRDLSLNYPNPWENDTYRTPTHLIMTHSAIEYFFRIID